MTRLLLSIYQLFKLRIPVFAAHSSGKYLSASLNDSCTGCVFW